MQVETNNTLPTAQATLVRINRVVRGIILDHVFFGYFALTLEFLIDDSVGTACTNGSYIKFSRQFVATLTDAELEGLIIHEILHVVGKHHLRRNGREPDRWNIACDCAINPLITKLRGVRLPPNGTEDAPSLADVRRRASNWSAEAIYAILPEEEGGDGSEEGDDGQCDLGKENGRGNSSHKE